MMLLLPSLLLPGIASCSMRPWLMPQADPTHEPYPNISLLLIPPFTLLLLLLLASFDNNGAPHPQIKPAGMLPVGPQPPGLQPPGRRRPTPTEHLHPQLKPAGLLPAGPQPPGLQPPGRFRPTPTENLPTPPGLLPHLPVPQWKG